MHALPTLPLPALDDRQRYTVEEAIQYLRTSRRSLYKLISTDQLKIIKQCKRTYVPGTELVRLSQVQP